MTTLTFVAPPLPVPAPATENLSLLFVDESKHPIGVNWDALMASFRHDAHNSGNNTDTNALSEMVTASGTQNKLLSFTVTHGNRDFLYTLRKRWQDGLTGQNTSLNGKFFAMEGRMIQDCGHIVEVDVGVFSLPIPVAVVPTVEAIADTLRK